jgi:signal transduction histidine kinase
MFTKADLGTYVIHMPIELPDGAAAVVDVVYRPLREQAILDSARAPMALVAFFATIVAVLMMQTIMGWVLSLVNRIRRTAESITAGRLDVHLPEEGEHEITELARSLNRLIDVLRTRSEAQTRFVADASHELATPVAGIRGYVNILRAWGGEDPGLREEALAAIDRESRRMARLCTDLLSVIRADEALEHRMKAYDVNAVARHVLAAAATRYIDKQIDFEGPEEGVREAWGDPDRIEEALGTLVDNACKYTPVGGAVRLTTMSTSMNAIVEVADTGVGIPEEDVASIFDRFYRSDASRSKETGGFGLGLAIAKHIIETNGGTISVRSIVGSGTTFTITLPKPGIGGGQ